MFGMKTIKEQALDLRRENVKLRIELDKTTADVTYIAMMTDIDLEIEEDNLEGEIDDGSEE